MIKLTAVMTNFGWVNLSITDFRKLLIRALRNVGERWWRKTMPKHFKPRASNAYGYRKRSAKYLRRKQREYGHQRPLVYTSRSETMARSSVKLAKRLGKVNVSLPAIPRYMYATKTKAGSSQPDKMKELGTTTKSEDKKMAELLRDEFSLALDADRSVKIRKL